MNYHDRKPPTITGRVERCRPASGKAIGATTSALPRWLSPRPFEPRAGAPEATRLGARLPDVPLQFEAIQIQNRSGKLPLGPGVARVEQQ
jgi:hypothetical protein